MVGSVIVFDNKIIGEGYTSKHGGNHAEVNAINSVKNKDLLKKATLYVTLEPCSHFGQTPPCCNLIIKHQIPKVVIGCVDENKKVAGKGIKRLKEAGCQVTLGVLNQDCQKHHQRFFTFHTKKRPYVILKWAASKDGFIAPLSKNKKQPVWISNAISRQMVHQWRTQEHGILVGTNTVLEDNPYLTARDWSGNQPTRIVLDKDGNLSNQANVFDDSSKTIVIKRKTAQAIAEDLFKSDINSVIIEGGTKTLQLFIDEGVWDEARVFTGPEYMHSGIKMPVFSGELVSEKSVATDLLRIYQNTTAIE